MKSNESLEDTLRKLRYRRPAERREQTLATVVAALDQSQKETPQATRREIGRIIMTSKLTKLAAAAVIVTTSVFLWRVSIGTNKAYALTDVPRLLQQARTVHVRIRRFSSGQELLLESWADVENGKTYEYRESLGSEEGPEGLQTVTTATETVFDGRFRMTVDRRARTVRFERLLTSMQEPMRLILTAMGSSGTLEDIENFDQYVKVDEAQIDGQPYDIWRREFRIARPYADGAASHPNDAIIRFEYWVSPATGRVGRMRQWHLRDRSDRQPELVSERDQIETDVEPPAGIFQTEPPVGYTALNEKETADLVGPGLVAHTTREGHTLRAPASFTLEDGSVLICWRGMRQGEGSGPDALYERLSFGGALPQAPAELAGLMSLPRGQAQQLGVRYVGRHLTVARKAGLVYEWALYVPREQVVPDDLFSHNIAAVRLRVDGQETNLSLPWSLTSFVVDAQSFARYVPAVVKELSDGQDVPGEMNYGRLLALARETRARPELYEDWLSSPGRDEVLQTIGRLAPVPPEEIVTPAQAAVAARRLVETFYAAIREGRNAEAVRMLMYDEARASRVVTGMKQLPGFAQIAVADIYATENSALVITSEFAGYEEQRGRWAISVLREKGQWLIKDFDATTTATMQEEIAKYLQQFPDARPSPGRQ